MAKKKSKKKSFDPYRQTPADVAFEWRCPECRYKTWWSYWSLATQGNPVCPDCDGELELQEDAKNA